MVTRPTPARFFKALKVTAVAVLLRGAGLLASDEGGSVILWGERDSGLFPPPREVCDAIQVVGNGQTTFALRSNGTVPGLEWLESQGISGVRQLAIGPSLLCALGGWGRPVAVWFDATGFSRRVMTYPEWTPVKQLACANGLEVIALHFDGSMALWRLGINRLTPIPGITNVVEVAASNYRWAAIQADGSVLESVSGNISEFTPVVGLQEVRAVAVGGGFSAALRSNGTVVTWGQFAPDTDDPTDIVAIAAGSRHLLALRRDGTVAARGDNSRGQTSVPSGLREVTAISVGPYSSMAITRRSRPVIRTEPSPVVQLHPAPVMFAVDAFGSCPLAYQWYRDGDPIPGATGPQLAIQTIQAAHEGSYSVLVSNPFGQQVSGPVALTVNPFEMADFGSVVPPPPNLTQVRALSSGSRHTLALLEDGTVAGWGDNWYAQSAPPSGLRDVVQVSAGGRHSLALRSDGTVVAWGDNSDAQRDPPAGTGPARMLSGGVRHSLALLQDGTVVAWGSNSDGQLDVPGGLSEVTAVAAGQDYSVAVRADGGVVVWGRNARTLLQPPPGLGVVRQIAAGWYHLVARLDNGNVVCWGENRMGECQVPRPLQNVIAIAAGDGFSAAVDSSGRMRSWGALSGLDRGGVAMLAGGGRHLAVLASPERSAAVAWRPGDSKSLIAGEPLSLSVEAFGTWPLRIQWFKDGALLSGETNKALTRRSLTASDAGTYWAEVSNAYGVHLSPVSKVALLGLPTGTVRSWGDHSHGEGTPPEGLHSVRTAAAGGGFSVAARHDGTVVAWGDPLSPAVGVPSGLGNVRALAAGDSHVIALREDGTLVAWGDNQHGQASIPANLPPVASIAAGYWHSLAVLHSGAVVAWGLGDGGATAVPASLGPVVSVAGGNGHSLALRADGSVVAWGTNRLGQAQVPADLPPVQAIAAGMHHSVALGKDGRVVCWGRNHSGQCSPPFDLDNVIAIGAGEHYSLALRRDGEIVVWGHASMRRPPREQFGTQWVVAGPRHALTLDPPPAPRLIAPHIPSFSEVISLVAPGGRYRLESSPDMRHWTIAAPEFIARDGTEVLTLPSTQPPSFLRLMVPP